jgi:hypothetical protein
MTLSALKFNLATYLAQPHAAVAEIEKCIGLTVFEQGLKWALSSNSIYLTEGKTNDTYPMRTTGNPERH